MKLTAFTNINSLQRLQHKDIKFQNSFMITERKLSGCGFSNDFPDVISKQQSMKEKLCVLVSVETQKFCVKHTVRMKSQDLCCGVGWTVTACCISVPLDHWSKSRLLQLQYCYMLTCTERQKRMAQVLGPVYSLGRPKESSWFPALDQPSLGCGSHVESKPVERSLCDSAFHINK